MKLGELTLRQIKEIKEHCADYFCCDGCPFKPLKSCNFYNVDEIDLDTDIDIDVEAEEC